MRPQLLLLGDSLTEKGSFWDNDGWICLLLQRFNRSADLRQRGMGSYTTKWFMDVVITTISNDLGTTLFPDLITLWLGANDSVLVDGPGASNHVPLDKFISNLHAMVAVFKSKAPQAKILLITPPAVDDDVRRKLNHGQLDRSNAAAGEYAKALVQVAKDEGVEAFDLHTLMNSMPEAEWKACLNDGQHFTKKGNRLVEQSIADIIKNKFPELDKKLQHWEFPHHHNTTLPEAKTWFEWIFGA